MHYEPNGVLFMQDGIHTVLKLRNRMPNLNDELPMGNKQVSAAHLKVKNPRRNEFTHCHFILKINLSVHS